MKCPKCGSDNRETVKFCEECGTKFEIECPVCKSKIPFDKKFCGECGSKLNLPTKPLPKEISFDDKLARIQKYLPGGLTKKILSQREKIEGECKQVTVLFCDLVGYTQLSEKLGHEETFTVMDKLFEILIHRIHDYEGTVNEIIGDGMMALFGAPIALEDAPQRAIRSAHTIHRDIAKFSEKIKRQHEWISPIKMRVGIHSGPVVLGTLGNDLRVEFTVIGDTVNLASRIEGLAEPGTTYVSGDTFKLTEGFFRFESLGTKEIKGKSEQVGIYRVIAPSTRKTRFDVSAERGLTQFVGRERELELLLDGFYRAKAGKGQAFSIIAEAGLGKSRLLYELRKTIANEDVTFLEGRCLSYSKKMAYHPVIDILKANFDIQEGDADIEIRKKVTNGLNALKADEKSTFPAFMELLSITDNSADKMRMSPEIKKDRINEALKQICIKGSEIRPLIMAFEDLHWMDKSSEESLKNWLDNISGARVLMIFTYRPEYLLTWGGRSYHNQVNLNRLSNRESLKMVYHLLDTDNLDKNLEEFILERTEGVPFFIEEFIRSVNELKIIKRRDSKYFLSHGISNITIPSTIHDVIMARVDSLPEGAKELLRIGSVIEREFNYKLLKLMMETSEAELLRHLSALKDSELIYERGIYPETICIFRHALTHQVVYDSIMTKRKKTLHEKVGSVIEKVYKSNIEECFAVLADHYFKSENFEKCVTFSIKAGDSAVGIFAWHEARNHYEIALKFLERKNIEKRAEVLKKLAFVTMSDLDVKISLKYAQSALKLFENVKDKTNQLDILMHIQSIYSGGYLDGSREDRAIEFLEKAASLVEKDPDTQEKGLIYQRTAHLYLHRGQPETSLSWANKAVDLFKRLGLPMGTSLGTALTYTGKTEQGFIYNEKNWPPVFKLGNPLIIGILGHELVLTKALVKDVPKGRQWGERILPEVRKAGFRYEGFLLRPLALIYVLSGETSKAKELCDLETSIEGKTLMSCFFEDAACIGFYFQRIGEWNQAKEYLEWAIPIHKDRNNVAALSACYFSLANIELEKKNYYDAEKLFLTSLDICRKGGNVIYELWILPLMCEVYLKIGKLEKADNCIERGFELMRSDQKWYGLPANLYLAKAMVLTKKKKWDLATDFFKKAIHLTQKYELLWDEAKIYYEWSLMYLGKSKNGGGNKETRDKLSLALQIFQRIGAKNEVKKVLNVKSTLS